MNRKRLRKIAIQGAEQSGREVIPSINSVVKFDEVMRTWDRSKRAFIACFAKPSRSISTIVADIKVENIGIFVGPEGGFAPQEVDMAMKVGIEQMSLGKRILRSETASLVSLA